MSNEVITMRKTRIKMTPIQVQMLVDILYENSEIASGKLSVSFSREERTKKWEAVATLLNSKGLGPQKTPEQWRKSWSDLKCGTRSKAAKIELAGGTDLMNEKLSNLEKRILQLSGDIAVENVEGSESKDKLTGKLFMKKLEEDLAKTEEDLLKAMKKPNQIVLPKTLSEILAERGGMCKQIPIVENVTAIENTDEEEKNDHNIEASNDCSPIVNDNCSVVNSESCIYYDGSDDDIIYDDSDVNEETADDPVKSREHLSPPTKKRKVVCSVDNGTPSSSASGSFISVFQRQIETQTAVLKEQTSIMRDIAKSLRLIASSLHNS